MIDVVCKHQESIMYLAPIIFAALEYWLGKTEKVKAGSLVELILNGIKFFFQRRKNGIG